MSGEPCLDESLLAEDDQKFAYGIIARMEKTMNIKLRELFDGEDKSAADIRTAVRERIIAYVQEQIDNEKPSEDWPCPGAERDAKKAMGLQDDVNVTPDVSVLESNYKVAITYEGQAQVDYVRRISNGLSLLSDGQSVGEMVGTIIGSGLSSFGLAMIWGTIGGLRKKLAFRAALALGVRAMGRASVVVGVASVIITEILLYLLVFNKKQFLGMVFNHTDLNLVVEDWRSGTGGQDKGGLYLSTGSVSTFMEQNEDEQYNSPMVQIGANLLIAPGDKDNLILAGLFFAEKNFGLYGTEGVMILRDRVQATPRFPLLFACPYVMDNGVNVAIDDNTDRSAKSAFDDMYGSRDLYKTVTASGYTFSARTAWKTGGQTMGLMWLHQN